MCPVCQARFLRIVQDIICSGSSIIMKETVLVAMVSVYLMKFRASLNISSVFQFSSTPCLGTQCPSRRGCCIQVVRILLWM